MEKHCGDENLSYRQQEFPGFEKNEAWGSRFYRSLRNVWASRYFVRYWRTWIRSGK